MTDILFRTDHLSRIFRSGRQKVIALDDITLDLKNGETLSLVGESGCGKTTLARTLLGVYTPDCGTVLWKGKDLQKLSRTELTDFRKRNQMIFQDPYASLDPRMTVMEIISEGMRRHLSLRPDERRKRVSELLETTGLREEFADRFPHELSGGQRQRIGIARALALEPECLFLDEPIAALDVSVQAQIINLLMKLQEEKDLTYLMISHDLSIVRHISDRIAVMYLGKIVELSDAEDLYESPKHPYTKALLSAIPQADPESGWLNRRIPLSGEVPDPTIQISGCRFAPRCPQASDLCRKQAPPLLEIQPGHMAACWNITDKSEAEER